MHSCRTTLNNSIQYELEAIRYLKLLPGSVLPHGEYKGLNTAACLTVNKYWMIQNTLKNMDSHKNLTSSSSSSKPVQFFTNPAKKHTNPAEVINSSSSTTAQSKMVANLKVGTVHLVLHVLVCFVDFTLC